jgi:predicted enzyme related to lactoylglutathione lyase
MTQPNMIILYVDNPAASAGFYAELFGKAPIEASPTFAMFGLDNGLMMGLWSKHTVEPAALATGGGAELAIGVAGKEGVDQLHADWIKRGIAIAQPPSEMDFGRTFVGLDPDGHRLRVFAAPTEH